MATVHLGRVVGAGGFQRLVAIKVMHPHIAADPEFVAMFLDEARLAAGIRHPNVVATLDIEQGQAGLFLVMEYVEGTSLHVILKMLSKDRRTLPTPIALRVCLDMLSGLEAAHELKGPHGELLGLVHRDMSPQNVLVGIDGVSRITDFGVARAEARLSSTRGSQVKGKVPYMSPEQLRSEDVDRRSDVWAAGVVLWEMLTGKRLFRAPSDGALVAVVMEGPKKRPTDLKADVPAAIDDVCMAALRPAAERHQSAAAFAEALEDAAAAAGVAVASSRHVGKFVRQLIEGSELVKLSDDLAGAGELPSDVKSSPVASARPASEPSGPYASAPMPISSTGRQPSVTDVDDFAPTVARDVTSDVSAVATAPSGPLPVTGSGASAVAALAKSQSPPPPARRSRGPLAVVALLLLTAGGAAVLALLRLGGSSSGPAASPPVSVPRNEAAEPPTPEPTLAPIPVEDIEAETIDAAAPPVASSPPRKRASPRHAGVFRKAPARPAAKPARPAAKPAPSPPKKRRTEYRPDDL